MRMHMQAHTYLSALSRTSGGFAAVLAPGRGWITSSLEASVRTYAHTRMCVRAHTHAHTTYIHRIHARLRTQKLARMHMQRVHST